MTDTEQVSKKPYKRTIAVDFDGVIHKYSGGYKDGSIYDDAVEGAIESLVRLRRNFTVVIFTTRGDTPEIREWIAYQSKKAGFSVDELVSLEITDKKPMAIAYIDDRGIRFTNWSDMIKYFM